MNISPEIKLGTTRTSEGFRKTTTVEIGGRVLRMTNGNRDHVRHVVADNLQPGMAVYLESIGCGHRSWKSWVKPALFLSDGSIDEFGRFGIQAGKHHTASAYFTSQGVPVVSTSGRQYHEGLSPAYSGTDHNFNEGTFSPAGGHYVSSYSAGGTARVIIGGRAESFVDPIDQIHFASDAITVQIPDFYKIANKAYSVTRESNRGKGKAEKEKGECELAELELLIFASNMLKIAMQQRDDDYLKRATEKGQRQYEYFQGYLDPHQFSTCIDGDTPFSIQRGKDKYTILPKDVFYNEPYPPKRRLGFLRPNGESFSHGGLFLPKNRDMERVAKMAFDPKFVERFYPQR